jgi:CoA:oxalate CoA-transferase
MRKRAKSRKGAGVPFAMLNANKKSIAIDLKSEAGLKIIRDLVATADVFVENYAPGVMERLGLGYEALSALNPKLVYASGSGYGQTGSTSLYPAMDLTIQAMGGVMSATGFPENPPVKAGPAIADFFGGTHLYGAIVTALFRRERQGKGSRIDVAMVESVYPSLASCLSTIYSDNDAIPPRTGNQHGGLSLSPYSVFATKDDRHIAIICNNNRHWYLLLEVMGREDLKGDERYDSPKDRVAHMDEVDKLVADWAVQFERDPLFEKLIANRVPSAPVRAVEEVIHDPAMHERGMLLEIDHPDQGRIVVCRSPLNIADIPRVDYQMSPGIGENNREVLCERLGVTAEAFEQLQSDGVI